jgi:AraC family transcriptional regulator
MTSDGGQGPGCALTVSGSDVAVYPPGATFGPRRLVDHEFVWLLEGSAEWGCDQGRVTLGPSSLLLGRPGMRDWFVWDRQRPTRHAYLHFEMAGRMAELPGPDAWPLARTLPDGDPLRPLLRYLLARGGSRPVDHDALRLLLILFVREPLGDPAARLPTSHLDALADFVGGVWAPPAPTRRLSLDELAAGACLSPAYLSRLFRRQYGIGPVAAMELLRLARAATLLARSNLSVAEVAGSCGFANPYHFSRRFSRAYGQPPGRWRRSPARQEAGDPVARAGLLAVGDRIWRAT